MTKQQQIRDYWQAAFTVRQNVGGVCQQFAAHKTLLNLTDNGLTADIRKAARQVVLGYGIAAPGFEWIEGGAA